MRAVKKIIISLFLIMLILNFNTAKAEEVLISSEDIPNSTKLINLKLSNKPLSYALKKLAEKGQFNVIISSEFQDGKISVNLKRVKVSEALNNLMSVGNFILIKNDSLIVATTKTQPEISSRIIPLQNTQAAQMAYLLSKSMISKEEDFVSHDEINNSLIVQGSETFINNVSASVEKLDLPKKTSTFKISKFSAKEIEELLNNKLFNNSYANKVKAFQSSNGKELPPISADESNVVIKAIVEKHEFEIVNTESPVIMSDEKANEITIIGNTHQISMAKELISHLDGKKIDKDEEIRRAHNEIYETKQELEKVKEDLEESQKLIANLSSSDVGLNTELENAQLRIESLNNEIKRLKAKKLWSELVPATQNDKEYYEQKIVKLVDQISNFERKVYEKESVIESLTNAKIELQNQLALKDQELEQAQMQIKELKGLLTEQKLQKDIVFSNVMNVKSDKILEETKVELKTTKNELNKVKQQLVASKQQLELIFGDKLLEDVKIPKTESLWFK